MKKSNIIFFSLFVFIYLFVGSSFCLAWTLNGCTGDNCTYFAIPGAPSITKDSKLPAYILYLFWAAVYVVGTIAVLSLVVAGIQFILSAENPTNRNAANERIRGTVIGMVILLGCVVLLKTINPALTELGLTLNKVDSPGLHFLGNGGEGGAPYKDSDLTTYNGKWDKLYYPEDIASMNGTVKNCDNNIFAYMVYFYSETNYGGTWDFAELKCGKFVRFDPDKEKSYIAVAEYPGVYFYSNRNCKPSSIDFSGNLPQSAHTTPEPELPTNTPLIGAIIGKSGDENIQCVRIINGSDPKKGPFYGVVLFKDRNYKGMDAVQFDHGLLTGDWPYIEGLKSPISGMNAPVDQWYSAAIYQKAAYNDNGKPMNPGLGVSLIYSAKNKSYAGDGKYCPNGPGDCHVGGKITGLNIWKKELSDMDITYSGNTPQDEQDSCPYFDSRDTDSKRADCFTSMTIANNFLVLLSDYKLENDTPAPFRAPFNGKGSTYAQAFPEAREPAGPSDLNTTDVGKQQKMQYIQVIPLAKPFEP